MAVTAIILNVVISKSLALLFTRLTQFAMIAVVLIPLERLIPFHPKQRLFRKQFGIDLLHYFVGGIFIIIFVRVTYYFMPMISRWARIGASPLSVRGLPV